MKVLIVGLGISGKASALYLLNKGDKVIGIDRFKKDMEGIEFIYESAQPQLNGVDFVVKSPGISQTHPWICTARLNNIPIVGEIDIALAELSEKKKIIFGITGSNGKTTTTLLTAHLLSTSGKKAIAVGNIGVPLISEIENDAEIFVVELSSFQLENIIQNPLFDAAVILNITPNHLDRHTSFEGYCLAKLRISMCLKKNAPFFISQQVAKLCNCQFQIFDSMKEKVETILSLGYRDSLYPHDLENISAAYALTKVSDDVLIKGITTFIRPPHRLEFIRSVLGVTYINDSKATSIDAVIKAVQAIQGPIILIAGGIDKGGAFRDWLPYFKGKVVRILALGPASLRIIKELGSEMLVDQISSLEEGVFMAHKMASEGSTVLLSPGCSSYDQFRDYQHRGETFRHIVKEKL